MEENRTYLCIDLKSFYASVECVERGLDPMTEKLVVADPERSDKTICLAVTPALKALGVKSRCRIFEIPKSISYLVAEPRMGLYLEYSAKIYGIYLKYVSKEDIHVYSIDEVFIDITSYLVLYEMDAFRLTDTILRDIFTETGIRATCGIGTNLYLAKVALDITAKRSKNFIGCLDEASYQQTLWEHKPLTDFWRIGAGTAKRLFKYGIETMGGIAHANEDFLYRLFGIDAELLIDHAWGREPTKISDIKAYKPRTNCLSSGQVLMCDYDFSDGRLVLSEMMDALCLEMVEKDVVTRSVSLMVGYSNSLKKEPAKGTVSIPRESSADSVWIPEILSLYDRIVNPDWPVRRINLTLNHVASEEKHQGSLFESIEKESQNRQIQETVIEIKRHFGKNALLKGIDLKDKATARDRNRQIGGHKSGE